MRPEKTKTKYTMKNKSPSITNNQFIHVSNKKPGVSTNTFETGASQNGASLLKYVIFHFGLVFFENRLKKLRIKTLLREGEPGAPSERRHLNDRWIGLINECFSARDLVLGVERRPEQEG